MLEIKISIIVPVYNVEKYLRKCLYNLSKLTLDDIEVIVVNDGSPDNSQIIIDEYVSRFPKLFKSYVKENGGVSSARNLGLEKASGEYIAFVDGDDYVEHDMYKSLYLKARQESADLVACGFNRVYMNSQGLENSNIVKPFYFEDETIFNKPVSENKTILFSVKPFLWNKIFRKNLFDGIRFPLNQVFEDDSIIYGLMFRANKIAVVNQPYYNYRISRGGSITSTFSNKMFDIFKACDAISLFFKENNAFEEYYAEIEYLTIIHIFARIRALARCRNYTLSFSFINKAFEYLDTNYHDWRDNRYYVIARTPYLLKHKVKGYNRVRENRNLLKIYYLSKKYTPYFIKAKKKVTKITRAMRQLKKIAINTQRASSKKNVSLTNEQLKYLQKEVLCILESVDAFCRRHSITYYMAEGSLIGAVRHSGFIPWDDDIDIMMPRKDYEKFLEIWTSQNIKQLRLLHYSTLENYYLPFAKIITVGETNFKSLIRVASDDLLGPSIDIFPIDGCRPIGDREQIKTCREIRILRNIILAKVGYMKNKRNRRRYFIRAKLNTLKSMQVKIDRLMQKYIDGNNEYVANLASSYPFNRECFKYEWFGAPQRVNFEDIYVNIPNQPDKILATIYGDYLTLPPEEKRVHRHSYKWIGVSSNINSIEEI